MGEPVPSGEPLVIKHCQTDKFLGADLVPAHTDFGVEHEVCTHSFHSQNKTQNMELEKKGLITVDVPTRF